MESRYEILNRMIAEFKTRAKLAKNVTDANSAWDTVLFLIDIQFERKERRL